MKSFEFHSQVTCDLNEYHHLVCKLPELVKQFKSETPFCGGLFVERAQPNFIVRSNKKDTITGVLKIVEELRCAYNKTVSSLRELTEGELELTSTILDVDADGPIFKNRRAIAHVIGQKGENIRVLRDDLITSTAQKLVACDQSLDQSVVKSCLRLSVTFESVGDHSTCTVKCPILMRDDVCEAILEEYSQQCDKLEKQHEERSRGVWTLVLPSESVPAPSASAPANGFVAVKSRKPSTTTETTTKTTKKPSTVRKSQVWSRVSESRFSVLDDTEA